MYFTGLCVRFILPNDILIAMDDYTKYLYVQEAIICKKIS